MHSSHIHFNLQNKLRLFISQLYISQQFSIKIQITKITEFILIIISK